MRAESGICNVCSAPCSSCLHIGRAFMRSKTDEFSDESSQGNGGSQCSVNGASHFKGAARQCRRHNSSETSNLLNISFNHDSLSKNARKASLRTFDVPGASKDDVMLQTCVSAGDAQLALKRKYSYDQRALSNKLEEQKFHGSHDYSASCVSISNEEAASDMVCGNRSAETCGRADDCGLVGDNTAASIKVCLNLEIETDKHSGYAEAVNSSEQLEEIEKVKESCRLTAANETSLQSLPEDDSDGSDTVEHDVKVCDICGDAGREDLLAICSRCSDGAEHTYCMREMMEKVPEGDWLCEECKFDEEVRSLKQDKNVTVDEHDKNQSFGLASTLNTNLVGKLNNKDSGIDGNKMNQDILNAKASIKRHGENIEMNSGLKRPAVDPTVCSPNTSSSSRVAAFSRDLSFRNLNKGKVKPAHHLSSGTCSIDDSSEAASSSTDPRLQAPRGALVKSNSFSFTNAKPRVKLVDDVVPQKQKSTREHAFLDIKEGGVKFIGKSMSFKSVNLGHLNPAESKLRMPLVKSPTQELKGLKQGREGDLLERKDSFKSERSLVSSALGNTTGSMLKGEVKRKSSSLGVAGASSTRGDSSSVEQKPDQNNLMYEPLSSTFTADRPISNASEYPPEALSRPRELANPCERIGESSGNHIRPTVTAGGRSDALKRSKETGCSTQSCTAENPQSLLGDVPAARSSELMNKDNQLKAAIEAAMLKKPGIYRKNKKPNQNDELNMSSTNLNCDVRPQDQLSTPINTRSIFATDELHEGQRVLWNFTAESCKQTTVSNVKQFSALYSKAGTLKAGDISSIDPYDVKPFRGDLPSHAPAAASVLYQMSTVPEHEYIWHGGFLVQRSGKLSELHHGIQAHLSTCASPKVLEMVNKFPSNILLNEVSRMSTWPVQFQEVGAKEDNIALYFFAKDLESYEKDYKTLLETMVVNDLALKGNFDGVELLIFPSNHLPEKSQRWNMLYFLWGVFRGKKVNHMQDVSSPQKCHIPRTLPNANMSLPESTCSLGPIDGDLATCSKSSIVSLSSKYPASVKPSCLSSDIQNGHCDTNASSLDTKRQCVQTNAGGQDSIFDATSLPRTGVASTLFQETRSTRTPLDENGDTDCKLDKKLVQPSVQPAGTISGSKKSDNYFPIRLDNGHDSNQISSFSSEIPASVSCSRDQETFERTWKELEGSLDAKPLLQNNHGKRLHEDSPWLVSQAAAGIDSTFLNGGCATKKQKTCYSGLHGDNNFRNVSSSTDFLAPEVHDVRSGSTITANRGEEALVEREVSRNSGIAERYLFTVDPHAVHNFSSGDKLVPLEVFSPDDDYDDDELPAEGVPNLELALGAEMKPSKQGILRPFLLGKVELRASDPDQPPEISASKEDRDDLSACLSLSLSFPFPVDEQTVKPESEVEQLLPYRRHVNPSLRFFEGSSDK